MENKLIFFDLDGTLSPQKTWFVFNTHFGLTPDEDHSLFEDYIHHTHDYQTWIEKLTQLLKSYGKCNKEAVEAFAATIQLQPDAEMLIDACKEKGYIPIIISGSIKQLADNVSKRLGINMVFSGSEILYNDDGTLFQIVNLGDEAIAKLRLFSELCSKYEVDSEQTIMVGDGGNDLEIFQRTKKAIQIGDYEPLKEYAWKRVSQLSDIIPLL